MREWITDRVPTFGDGVNGLVYNSNGDAVLYTTIHIGDAWKPIPKCKPYVKPKRWNAEWSEQVASWTIKGPNYYQRDVLWQLFDRGAHSEAAERIAAIYDEVMP